MWKEFYYIFWLFYEIFAILFRFYCNFISLFLFSSPCFLLITLAFLCDFSNQNSWPFLAPSVIFFTFSNLNDSRLFNSKHTRFTCEHLWINGHWQVELEWTVYFNPFPGSVPWRPTLSIYEASVMIYERIT